jgi:hypothetical protein
LRGVRIIGCMPRSSAQSDFVIQSEHEVFSEPALPPHADAVSLPKATWRSNLASARATTLVYWFVGLTLLSLLLLTVIGPHIPSGE